MRSYQNRCVQEASENTSWTDNFGAKSICLPLRTFNKYLGSNMQGTNEADQGEIHHNNWINHRK
jgi:hypothetical protein